jgi:predicted acetyltransferase
MNFKDIFNKKNTDLHVRIGVFFKNGYFVIINFFGRSPAGRAIHSNLLQKKAKGFSLLSLTQNTASNAVFSKCYHFSVPANKKVDLKRLLFLIFD